MAKQYVLKSLRELVEQLEKQGQDGPSKIIKFFSFEGSRGRQLGEGSEQRGTGVEGQGRLPGEGNGPMKETDGGQNVDVHGG